MWCLSLKWKLHSSCWCDFKDFPYIIWGSHRREGHCLFPEEDANPSLIPLFSIGTAKGSIMGLLRPTCIMLNLSGQHCCAPLSQPPSTCSNQAALTNRIGVSLGPRCQACHSKPLVTLYCRLCWGENLGSGIAEDDGGPAWLSPNEASHGYPSKTDYYVVPSLTLMGCYKDLKWFNGSQVGAPNGPLYTSMRIMNGNDSVVKYLGFFVFPFALTCFSKRLLRLCDRYRFVWWEGADAAENSPTLDGFLRHSSQEVHLCKDAFEHSVMCTFSNLLLLIISIVDSYHQYFANSLISPDYFGSIFYYVFLCFEKRHEFSVFVQTASISRL